MVKKKKDDEQAFIRYKAVDCPALNVRSGPSTDSLIVKVLTKGTIVECDKNFNNDGWDHIICDPNVVGFCMKCYLKPLDPDTTATFRRTPIVIHSNRSSCDGDVVVNKENEEHGSEEDK